MNQHNAVYDVKGPGDGKGDIISRADDTGRRFADLRHPRLVFAGFRDIFRDDFVTPNRRNQRDGFSDAIFPDANGKC